MNSSRMERLLIEYSSIPERRKELEIKLRETELFKQNAADTLRVPVFDGMPHSKQMRDLVFEAVRKILDEFQIHIDYYTGQLRQYNQAEISMYNALKCLESHEYNVIYWRYIKGYRWGIVSMKTNYCEKQCRNIKDAALGKLLCEYKE